MHEPNSQFFKILMSQPVRALGLGIAWIAAICAVFALLIRNLPA